jgi:AcrR family transcriptional regulator
MTARRRSWQAALSRQAVVEAGLRVVAADGVAGLTMRRVAQELDTGAMSLYRHVSDKQQLLVLMLDEVATRCPPLPETADPVGCLIEAWLVVHDHLADYPWVVEVLAAGDVFAPRALRLLDLVAATLTRAGFDDAAAMTGYLAIWHLVLGSLVARRTWLPQVRARRVELLRAAPLDDLPDARRLLAAAAGWDPRETFRAQLTALVEGILAGSGRS